MESLTKAPSEETVQQYVDIFQKLDWQTGLKGLLTLVLGLAVVRLLLRFVRKLLEHSKIPATVHTILMTLLRVLLDLVVILSATSAIGIPVTSFVTLLGLAGLAVSLALQGILSNLASGFIILTSHPFEAGHFIEQEGFTGTVQEIRMLHTRLLTPDGKMIYVPNSVLSGTRIVNYSETGKRRVEISVSASYDSSPDQVRKAILDAVKSMDAVLEDPAPYVFLDDYGDSAIRYTLWVWVNGSDFLSVSHGLREKLYKTFSAHGVVMTYPHLNVHLTNSDSPS